MSYDLANLPIQRYVGVTGADLLALAVPWANGDGAVVFGSDVKHAFFSLEAEDNTMDELDIDGLDIAALMALNARVVERLQFLHQQKTTAALQEIKIGSAVMFEGPDGVVIHGIVIRRNRKTVSVHADDERQWNVSPSLLTLTGRHQLDGVVSKQGDVVPFAKPGRK